MERGMIVNEENMKSKEGGERGMEEEEKDRTRKKKMETRKGKGGGRI